MNDAKRKRLEAMGCTVYEDAADACKLSPEQREENELRSRLARAIWRLRVASKDTQASAAKRLATSQSRYAEIELGASASLDRMFAAYFTFGGTLHDLDHNSRPYDDAEKAARHDRPRRAPRRTKSKT